MIARDVVYMLTAHVTILATTLAGFVFAWLREGRRHKWRIEESAKIHQLLELLRVDVKNGHDR